MRLARVGSWLTTAIGVLVVGCLFNVAYAQGQTACTTAGEPVWCGLTDMTQGIYYIVRCDETPTQTFTNVEPMLAELARLEGKQGAEVETCGYDRDTKESWTQNQCARRSDGLIRPKRPTEACLQ